MLAVLAHAAAAAREGDTRLVFLTGEAGIGKTAVLTEAARRLTADGWRLLRGQCWQSDGIPAYWPWVQVVRSAVEQERPERTGVLDRLLSPGGSGADQPGEPPAARFELFDGVVRQLVILARRWPVAVILDDLQWADDASLALLGFVARHLHQVGTLLLGAYRDTEAPAGLGELALPADIVPLSGLELTEVAVLIAQVAHADPSPDLARVMLARTGGNPLFLRELTRVVMVQGRLPEAGQGLPPALSGVQETLHRALSRLSPPCGRVLAVAAIAGPEFHLETLRQMLPSLDNLPGLLGEAVAARVLSGPDAPGGTTYRFSHELFRETACASLTTTESCRLHGLCGRVLEALARIGTHVHAADIAAHFVAASQADADMSAAAVAWSKRAATEALDQFAADDACLHYQRALDVLDSVGPGSEEERIDLLLRLADSYSRAGDGQAARSSYHQAAGLARDMRSADGLSRAAIGLHGLGAPTGLSHAEPVAMLKEAADALGSTDSQLRALVLASLARDYFHSWEDDCRDRAKTLAEEAVGIARRLDDPVTLSRCLLAMHDILWLPGLVRQRLAVAEEIVTLSEATSDRDLYALALLLRATAKLELGDPAGYRDLTGHCHESSEAGHSRGRWQALSRSATAALIDGDLAAASALSNQAAELGRRIGEPDWSSVADGQLWEVLRFSGQRRRYADLGHSGDILNSWPPWQAVGLADNGDLKAAADLLTGFDLDRSFRPGPRTNPEPWSMVIVAEAVAAAGTTAQREEMYRRLIPLAGHHVITGGCASYSGAFDHYLGLLAEALGQPSRAAAHFTDAAGMHERLGAPAWCELSRRHRDLVASTGQDKSAARPVLRSAGDTWHLTYLGQDAHLPDLKGLHDLATLLAQPGQPVHVMQLLTGYQVAPSGADPILDEQARVAYRKRIGELDILIDDADASNDLYRAERARLERDALVREIAAATGLGGRYRHLGDDSERARKTVTSRIRDVISRIRPRHPRLAEHLAASVTTGTWCCYTPERDSDRAVSVSGPASARKRPSGFKAGE